MYAGLYLSFLLSIAKHTILTQATTVSSGARPGSKGPVPGSAVQGDTAAATTAASGSAPVKPAAATTAATTVTTTKEKEAVGDNTEVVVTDDSEQNAEDLAEAERRVVREKKEAEYIVLTILLGMVSVNRLFLNFCTGCSPMVCFSFSVSLARFALSLAFTIDYQILGTCA